MVECASTILNSSEFYIKCTNDSNTLNCVICNIEQFIPEQWIEILEKEFAKKYFILLKTKLHQTSFYPSPQNVFSFIKYFSLQHTRIVILGQDPYHGKDQAMGLAFSVPSHVKIPPSLRNIYKELKSDIPGFQIPSHGNLEKWAQQGVLLLNDVLTVKPNSAGSHSKYGWQYFTNEILRVIDLDCSNVVFMLWGNHAKSKSKLIDKTRHLVLESAHPSPFSARLFFGCKHFSKANEYLCKHGKDKIDWQID